MVFSEYKLQRILYYSLQGHKAPTISHLLEEEDLRASRVGVAKFLKKYQQTGSISQRPGSSRPSKITSEIKTLVEQKMRADDETTAVQLHAMLRDPWLQHLATDNSSLSHLAGVDLSRR